MKKILTTATIATFMATASFAGDFSEPVITEVKETEAASSAPWLPLLLLLGAVILIGSQDDNSRPVQTRNQP